MELLEQFPVDAIITVFQRHAKEGIPTSCTDCALAYAATDRFGANASVDGERIEFCEKDVVYTAANEDTQAFMDYFIEEFDILDKIDEAEYHDSLETFISAMFSDERASDNRIEFRVKRVR